MPAAPPPTSTLTSLLNSLHTHLQQQTQLLPTLHAQLGLPSSAIEDDLKSLQQKLMVEVEAQINGRRREVEQWMERCVEVENACLRYTKSLGGNTKATGSSLGEIRKEQALPKRYELVSEFQEKLRQVYHTKLEQLQSIKNRLNVLAKTLGSEFFSPGALESAFSPGENPADSNGDQDVTPERFLKLEKELVKGKAEVTRRLAQLSQKLVQIDWLYTELGITPSGFDDITSPVTSPHASASASSSRNSLPSDSDPFAITTPTPACKSRPSKTPMLFRDTAINPEVEYERVLADFITRLEEADEEGLPEVQGVPVGLENVEPTQGLLEWATTLEASLEEIKRRRETHIQAMYDQLESLWRRLGVGEESMDAFVDAHRGTTETTVKQYEEELDRMLQLKHERMGAFIQSAREEIIALWDELMVPDDEREDFAPFADDEFTEELLALHDDEIHKLKEERRTKAPLLASMKKYFDICQEEKDLLAAASDQTRLTGRNRDPGRLLREEKMRKRVKKEKPRLEKDLLASIPAWETDTGRQFLVNGEPFLPILMERVATADEGKRRTRSGSVQPRAKTPAVQPVATNPAARLNPNTSDAESLPNKRQRLNSGPTQPKGAPATVTRQPSRNTRAVTMAARRAPPAGTGTIAGGRKMPVTSNATPAIRTPSLATNTPRVGIPAAAGATFTFTFGRPLNTGPATYTTARSTFHSTAGTFGGGNQLSTGAAKAEMRNNPANLAKKAERARRESFKPRPSVDQVDVKPHLGRSVAAAAAPGAQRWPVVKEEEMSD